MPPSATIGGPDESLSRKRLTGEVKQSTEDEGWEEARFAAILGLHPLSVPDAAGEAPEHLRKEKLERPWRRGRSGI